MTNTSLLGSLGQRSQYDLLLRQVVIEVDVEVTRKMGANGGVELGVPTLAKYNAKAELSSQRKTGARVRIVLDPVEDAPTMGNTGENSIRG